LATADFIGKITHGDNVEIMRQMDADSVDLTVTSPPYDNLRTYNGYSFDFENVAWELYRITKPGGVIVWVVNDATVSGSETLTSFKQALYFREIGFNVHDTMIYQKSGVTFPETNRYYPCFEYMFVFSKGKPVTTNLIEDRRNNNGGDKVTGSCRQVNGELTEIIGQRKGRVVKDYGVRYNIWRVDSGYMKTTKDKFAYEHPAMFPESLAQDHIVSWSNPGDIVFDPFGGSGTTAKMALLNGRRFIHVDMSEEYCEIARKRIESAETSALSI
jgi:site-specific DNA-methyltransferase (adenine-specific)